MFHLKMRCGIRYGENHRWYIPPYGWSRKPSFFKAEPWEVERWVFNIQKTYSESNTLLIVEKFSLLWLLKKIFRRKEPAS